MRVIAGSARHLRLKTLDTNDTRPTTDRIKETLFNIIQNEIYDSQFLDLFSGSGAIGIEALSRGAKRCVFVENNPKAYECIKENLDFTKLSDDAEIMNMSVRTAISNLEVRNVVFDIVYMDPPYNSTLEKHVLEQISKSVIINNDTLIIIEASKETDFSYLEIYGFDLIREKEYKTNKHLFVKRKGIKND